MHSLNYLPRMQVRPVHTLSALLYAIVSLAILTRLNVLWQYEINWDEFYFLSHIYEHLRGQMEAGLQKVYVHAFTWLARFPADEIGQIKVARALMLLLQLLTGYLLFRIARCFFPAPAALFAALSYASFSYVILHGTSFRADPIATCLLVGCIYLILHSPTNTRGMVAAGITLGLAMCVTIKSVLYLPAIAALLLIQLYEQRWQRPLLLRQLLMMGVALTVFILLHWCHRYLVGEALQVDTGAKATRIYSETLNNSGFFPRWSYLRQSLFSNGAYWLVLLVSAVLAGIGLSNRQRSERAANLYLLALCLPLVTLAGYHNSYPYFYVFILAPASIICAHFWHSLPAIIGSRYWTACAIAILALYLLSLISFGWYRPADHNNAYQQTLINTVHRMFPEPVPYIDRNSMIASFPKSGFFMSNWGRQRYHSAGEPIIAQAIPQQQPKFVLANSSFLNLLGGVQERPGGLLTEDMAALQHNFIHHWGPIYIAGKQLALNAPGRPITFDLAIAGTYSIEASSPVVINGTSHPPGSSVLLEQGRHQLSATEAGTVTLRWGVDIYRPQSELHFLPVYRGFSDG